MEAQIIKLQSQVASSGNEALEIKSKLEYAIKGLRDEVSEMNNASL